MPDPMDDGEMGGTLGTHVQDAPWHLHLVAVQHQADAVLTVVFEDRIPGAVPEIPGMRRPVSGQNTGPRGGLWGFCLHEEIW